MTVTVTILGPIPDRPDGRPPFIARCRQHPGWRCEAETAEELRGKFERSLKSYISRHLRFEVYVSRTAL